MTSRTKSLQAAFLLTLIIVAVFSPALHYSFIGLDDDELVVRNQDVKVLSFDRLGHLLKRHYITLYIPVTMLSYALDYQIWHLTAFGFRFTSLILHLLNTLLVFYLIRLFQKNLLLAFAVSLIFAVHPVQIESVIWIGERKNVLSTFFLLLTIIFYWKALIHEQQERKWLAGSLGVFILGLLSKPSIVIFPLILILMHQYFYGGQYRFKKRAWFYISVIIACALATGTTIFGTAADVEKYTYHGGSYWTNLLVMLTVFWKYWLLLLFPFHQNILYSSPIYHSILTPPVLTSAAGLLTFFIFLWVLNKRNKLATFWFCWFLIGLIPVANLIAPLPSIMNDRYLYVPIIGFFAGVFTWLGDFVMHRKPESFRWVVLYVLIILAVPYVAITSQRIPDWKNAETLWQSALDRAPRPDSRIYYYYGINQLDRGNYERSVELLETAYKLHASIDSLLALGTACVAAEKYEEAEDYLKEVIERDPKRSGAYDQLAVVYRKTRRFEEARPLFEKAIELQPRNAVLYNNYGLFFMDVAQSEKAKETWEYALKLDPDCHFALRNLAWFHFMKQDWPAAAHYLLRYLRRAPNDQQMLDLIPQIETHLTVQEPSSSPA